MGAAATGAAQEAGTQKGAFSLPARDALLENGDAAGQGAAPSHPKQPEVVGARDGRGDEKQGLMHR